MPNDGHCCVEPWVVGQRVAASACWDTMACRGTHAISTKSCKGWRKRIFLNPQWLAVWWFGALKISTFSDPNWIPQEKSEKRSPKWTDHRPASAFASIWGDHLCYHEHVQRDQRLATGGVSPWCCQWPIKIPQVKYVPTYVHTYSYMHYVTLHLHYITLHHIMFNYITLR